MVKPSKIVWLAVVIAPLWTAPAYSDCRYPVAELGPVTDRLAALVSAADSSTTDKRSNEPVMRTTMQFADGSLIIVEQKNCSIENLSISLFSASTFPENTETKRMGEVLKLTPFWKNNGAQTRDVEGSMSSLSRSDDLKQASISGSSAKIGAKQIGLTAFDGLQAAIAYSPIRSHGTQFRSLTTLILSSGGN